MINIILLIAILCAAVCWSIASTTKARQVWLKAAFVGAIIWLSVGLTYWVEMGESQPVTGKPPAGSIILRAARTTDEGFYYVWVYPKVLEHDVLSPKKLSEAMDKGPRTFYFKQEKMEKMQKQAESKGWIMVMEDDKVILVDPTKILVKEEE